MLEDYDTLLAFDKLKQNTEKLAESFKEAQPWPHIVLDDFFDEMVLDTILDEIEESRSGWHEFDTKYEKKMQLHKDELLGPTTRAFLHNLNAQPFLEFLSKVTGIERLVPDPYYVGGGYHQIPRGGKLGVHVDFNQHATLGLYRRLNIIIYLNKQWKDEYGGHFQLWEKESNKCQKSVSPQFNRVAIFETTSSSFHGHPEPLNCPEGMFRRSLALYYYSPDRGGQMKDKHSTIFLLEDGQTEQLFNGPSFADKVKGTVKKVIGYK